MFGKSILEWTIAASLSVILQALYVDQVSGCSIPMEDLRRVESRGSIRRTFTGIGSCTWTLPEKPINNHFLVLDFKDVRMPTGGLSIPNHELPIYSSPFCILYASPSLSCNIIWMKANFPPAYLLCVVKEVDSLPRNITYSNTYGRTQNIFVMEYVFGNCQGNLIHRTTTIAKSKAAPFATTAILLDANATTARSDTGRRTDNVQSSNMAAVIVAVILGISLIAVLLVIILLSRRLQQTKDAHVRSLVRFSRHGKSDQSVAQPGTSCQEEGPCATIGAQQAAAGTAQAVAGSSLHGQNMPEEHQGLPTGATGGTNPPTGHCVYATVNKPKP